MKQKIILICMLLISSYAIAQQSPEPIYTLTETGVQPKGKFINDLDAGNYTNVTPYVRYKISQITSRDNLYNYQVEMLKYKGWENDAGVANVIEISNGSNKILTLKNCEAWLNLAADPDTGSSTTQPFIPVYLSNGDIALLFVEYIYASQPSHLMIVLLRKGTATVVFNKPYFLNSVNIAENSFGAAIQSNTVEWIDDKAINAPDVSHILTNNGIMNFVAK